MARTTIYCVQAYWRDRRRLAMGRLRQFSTEEQARAAAQRVARSNDGVIAYELSGDPEFDHWEEPRVLATFGETPLVQT